MQEKEFPGGYNGTILRVNLTSKKIATESIDESFCRKYIGGAGFIAHYLLSEVKPDVDPLDADNKLIFALGPLSGINLAGCARHTVGAKSPLTGGLVKSEVGEHWGAQLKRAGFDALIIEGRSEAPVYLSIHNDDVQIKSAGHLWGEKTKETQEAIRAELNDAKTRVAMIGPGGENQVKFACIMHGTFDTAGRGGLGAVMGSKNLKAVAVRGSRMPPIADAEGVKKTINWLKDNIGLVKVFQDFGTGLAMSQFEEIGNLPIRNFRDGVFPDAEKISAKALADTIRTKMDGCFACPVRCKKVVQLKEPYSIAKTYGGPEYETLAAFGSACGIDNLNAIAKANEMCNAFSIDTISAGLTIAFAMECFENGLLTSEDTNGLKLEFGNEQAMLKMIEYIVHRKGIGELLAEGSARAAEKIGKTAGAFCMHVKKMELPMHDPRLSNALGLGYMVNPHGPDHMDSLIDLFFSAFGKGPDVIVPDIVPLGIDSAPLEDIGPKKVALFKAFQAKRIIFDSLVVCAFLPYSYSQLAELTSAVTGWTTSIMEQVRVAERILTMFRLYNIRAGLSDEDDKLPSRFFGPTRDGALADKSLSAEEMDSAKRYYYLLMGWDEHGVPLPGKLKELGINN